MEEPGGSLYNAAERSCDAEVAGIEDGSKVASGFPSHQREGFGDSAENAISGA